MIACQNSAFAVLPTGIRSVIPWFPLPALLREPSQITVSPSVSVRCGLFVSFKKLNLRRIRSFQTLFSKHLGWGYTPQFRPAESTTSKRSDVQTVLTPLESAFTPNRGRDDITASASRWSEYTERCPPYQLRAEGGRDAHYRSGLTCTATDGRGTGYGQWGGDGDNFAAQPPRPRRGAQLLCGASSSRACGAGSERFHAVVLRTAGRTGGGIFGGPSHRNSQGGVAQTETRSPRRGFVATSVTRKSLPSDLVAFGGATRSAQSAAASPPVGAHARGPGERAASAGAQPRLATWYGLVERARPTAVGGVAAGALHGGAAQPTASPAAEVRNADQQARRAGAAGSLPASAGTLADDAPRRGSGHRIGQRSVPGRSRALCRRQSCG